jgi:hypothetical protein
MFHTAVMALDPDTALTRLNGLGIRVLGLITIVIAIGLWKLAKRGSVGEAAGTAAVVIIMGVIGLGGVALLAAGPDLLAYFTTASTGPAK